MSKFEELHLPNTTEGFVQEYKMYMQLSELVFAALTMTDEERGVILSITNDIMLCKVDEEDKVQALFQQGVTMLLSQTEIAKRRWAAEAENCTCGKHDEEDSE